MGNPAIGIRAEGDSCTHDLHYALGGVIFSNVDRGGATCFRHTEDIGPARDYRVRALLLVVKVTIIRKQCCFERATFPEA